MDKKFITAFLRVAMFVLLSPSAIADLVLQSALSTAAQVMQVSGRGDAVRIVLNNPAAEFGFTPFKFVIGVPLSAYRGG